MGPARVGYNARHGRVHPSTRAGEGRDAAATAPATGAVPRAAPLLPCADSLHGADAPAGRVHRAAGAGAGVPWDPGHVVVADLADAGPAAAGMRRGLRSDRCSGVGVRVAALPAD